MRTQTVECSPVKKELYTLIQFGAIGPPLLFCHGWFPASACESEYVAPHGPSAETVEPSEYGSIPPGATSVPAILKVCNAADAGEFFFFADAGH